MDGCKWILLVRSYSTTTAVRERHLSGPITDLLVQLASSQTNDFQREIRIVQDLHRNLGRSI